MMKWLAERYANRSWLRVRTIKIEGELYMWRLQIFRTKWLVMYLHKVYLSETADVIHTHPGKSLSVPLWGRVKESLFVYRLANGWALYRERVLRPLGVYYRNHHIYHRLDTVGGCVYVSLFVGWDWRHPWEKVNLKSGAVVWIDEDFERREEHYHTNYGDNNKVEFGGEDEKT